MNHLKKIIFICNFCNVLLCNWEVMSFPVSVINGLTFNENNIFVVDIEGEVFQSIDEGDTWVSISQIPDIFPYGADVFKQIGNYLFFSQNIGGGITNYRSYYNGELWEEWEEISYQLSTINDLIHYNNKIYTIFNNEIVKSMDYGDSWISIGNPDTEGYLNLLSVDSGYIYVSHGCNLFRASTEDYNWVNITGILDQIGPPDPYACTMINDMEYSGNNLVISMYWYGGVGTLFYSEDYGDNWIEITSFPAVYSTGFFYSISELLYKNGVLYAGTASSQYGIFYTENLIDWTDYSDGLSSFSLSINELYSTDNYLYKMGGTVSIYKNQLINVSVYGDINQDGVINILDVISIVNLILSYEYSQLADVNQDGSVNILDVLIMVNILLGGLP